MYYTIEGKRFLCILYVIGLLTGTFFINVSIKMNLFRVSDFLGFTEYVKTLEGLDSNAFFSQGDGRRGRYVSRHRRTYGREDRSDSCGRGKDCPPETRTRARGKAAGVPCRSDIGRRADGL